MYLQMKYASDIHYISVREVKFKVNVYMVLTTPLFNVRHSEYQYG